MSGVGWSTSQATRRNCWSTDNRMIKEYLTLNVPASPRLISPDPQVTFVWQPDNI